MTLPSTLPVEEIVLDRIQREMRRCGHELGPSRSVLRAISNTLNHQDLTDAERGLLKRLRRDSRAGGSDEVASVLAHRIRAALTAGLVAAVSEVKLEQALASPGVYIVRREEKTSEDEHSTQFATALAEARGELERLAAGAGEVARAASVDLDAVTEKVASDPGLLVLAEDEIFDRIREQLKHALRGGKRSVAFYERDNAESMDEFRRVPAAVEVVRVEGDSTSFEERVQEERRQLAKLQVALEEERDSLVGTLFHGKYRIVRRIGAGGFGDVYEASDERGAGNPVAIKVMRRDRAPDPRELAAFRDEAKRVTLLDHPNIVQWKVFDQDEEGTQYFVMELLSGEELDRILAKEGPLEPERAGRMLLDILSALRAAHRLPDGASILHLDLKPRNVFVVPPRPGRDEHVKVFDFGVSQLVGGDEEQPQREPSEEVGPDDLLEFLPEESPGTLSFSMGPRTAVALVDEAGKPFTRCVAGTPEFASPEQCAHMSGEADIAPLDGRSDLYSLGVAAYQSLTGEYPFPQPVERYDLLRIHREEPFRKLVDHPAKIPKRLARWVDRCLEKEPDARFADADEAHGELERIVNPPVTRKLWPLIPAIAVVGFLVWFLNRPDETVQMPAVIALGPEQTSILQDLRVDDAGVLPDPGTAARLVRVADGVPMTAFAAVVEEGRVRLEAFEGQLDSAAVLRERVRLECDDGRIAPTEFDLVWIGSDSWSGELSVKKKTPAELAALALDPRGLALEIHVRGEGRAHVAEARVEVNGVSRTITAFSKFEQERTFRMDLDELADLGPSAELEVTLVDAAAHEVPLPLSLRTRTDLPNVRREEILNDADGVPDASDPRVSKMGTSWLITPASTPVLCLELDSKADVTWSYDGYEGPIGSREGEMLFLIPLEGLGEFGNGLSYQERLTYTIDDSAYVVSQNPRSGTGELEFEYSVATGTFQLFVDDREPAQAATVPVATSRPELIVRGGDAPRIQVQIELRDSEGLSRHVDPRDVRGRGDERIELPELADGRYAVSVTSYLYQADGDRTSEEASARRDIVLLVDTVSDAITIGELARSLFTTESALEAVEIELDSAGAPPSALALTPRVLPLGGGAPVWTGEELVVTNPLGRVPVPLGQDFPPAEMEGDRYRVADGRYRLEISGRDDAGNPTQVAHAEIEVAREGPEITMRVPRAGQRWLPSAGDWEVEFDALDPNGVASATCSLRSLTGGMLTIPVALDGVSTFRGERRIEHTWSEAQIVVEIRVRDAHGNEGVTLIEPVTLPLIPRARPPLLLTGRDGLPPTRMRFVPGNDTFAYEFGGRTDSTERADFEDVGRSADYFDRERRTQEGWQVEYPRETIEPYYLDESETTVREFLAFVEAGDGWTRATWWPKVRPDPTRRDELERLLRADAAESPVTGVTWDEASAYAAWAGKRLPSVVEWEFAVRGGSRYRIFAAQSSSDSAAVVANHGTSGSGPDVTEDGLRDLGLGVSEWTATPADVGELRPGQYASENRDEMLRPAAGGAREYWWAGGFECASGGNVFSTEEVDFSLMRPAERNRRDPRLGFRCALSLQAYYDSLEPGAALQGRFWAP